MKRWMAALAAAGHAHPRGAVIAAAMIATLIAMYPVILFGQSLVSPNLGGVRLLYREPPFTPGFDHTTLDSARNSDVGSTMWALLPYSIVQREALSHGEWPLWNRYNSAGRPLWGQGQTFFLDPLHWPTLLLPDVALGWDVKFVLHRLVFAIGVGLCVLALTGSWPAAAAMAFMAPFARQYLFRLNHPAQFALTYAPFVLLAWLHIAAAVGIGALARGAASLAVATALVLFASPPKEAAVMLIAMHGTGLLTCILAPAGWLPLVRQLLAAGAGILVAALLSAPQWLVFLDTLGKSVTLYDRPAVTFAAWVMPIGFFLSPLSAGVLVSGVHALAFAAFCATLAAGRAAWANPRTLAMVCGAGLAFGLTYGLVPAGILARLPLVANIGQIDHTTTAALIVLLLVAGGIGVTRIFAGAWAASTTIMFAGCAGLLALLAVNIHQTSITMGDFEVWRVWTIALAATLWIPLTAAAARRWPDPGTAAASLLVAMAILLPNGLHVQTSDTRMNDRLTQPQPRADFTATSGAIDALRRDWAEPYRVAGLEGIMFAGTQAIYGLEGFNGPDALWLGRYEELLNATGIERSGAWDAVITRPYLPTVSPVLDLLGIRYVLAPNHEMPLVADVLRTERPDRVRAVRRAGAWPRAFFVDRVAAHSTMAELADQVRTARGPFATMLQEERAAIGAIPQAAAGTVVPADRYDLTTNRTSFHIRASGPGLAVLTESWMPGDFRATLNGQPASYVRVNHAFKGVPIPGAGNWHVSLVYRPARFTLSLVLASAGILLLAGFGWLSLSRSR